MISSFCVPVKIGGKVVGVVGIDVEFKEIQEIMSKISLISDRSSLQLIANGGTIIYSPEKSRIGKKLADIIAGQDSAPDVLAAIHAGKSFYTYDYAALLKGDALKAYSPVRLGSSRQAMSINALKERCMPATHGTDAG